MGPFFPLSRNVFHTRVVLPGFEVILTNYVVISPQTKESQFSTEQLSIASMSAQ